MKRSTIIVFAFGAVSAAALLTSLGAALPAKDAQVGRYQITGVGDHAFMIDTSTGRVWQTPASYYNNRSDDFEKPKTTSP